MAESFNIYLDEICHLENDGINVMTLGAVWCPQEKAREIAMRVRDIRQLHGLAKDFEIKWTKVSPAKSVFYQAVIDYFLDDDDLHFRAVVIPDKKLLDHGRFSQSHDDWYYKMCFTLLEPIVDPTQHYLVVLAERTRKHDGFQYLQLITAYQTPEDSRKRKLRAERDSAGP